MDDRLASAITVAILHTKDKKVKRVLFRVLALNAEINCLDWNDWEDYTSSDEFVSDMTKYFKEV